MSIAVNHEKKLKQVLQERREEILAIALKHGAFNVRVFGSVARGEETENSDIVWCPLSVCIISLRIGC